MPDFNQTVKDSAYAAVGLGVLGFQKAQVRRHELAGQLKTQRHAVESQLGGFTKLLDEQITPARKHLGDIGDVVDTQVSAVRAQIHDLAKAVDETVAPARRGLDRRVAELEERLPCSARSALQTVRTAVATPEAVLRSAFGLD
ncbi:MAG: hypothetical protein ACYC1D_11350 [Acidimicrobiales bacterium]